MWHASMVLLCRYDVDALGAFQKLQEVAAAHVLEFATSVEEDEAILQRTG